MPNMQRAMKCRDGTHRQVGAHLAQLAADNDNWPATEPHCRQSYDLGRALDSWRAARQLALLRRAA